MDEEIYCYIVDLPESVSEMVVPCEDGYCVYLNARLSYQRQLEAYLHAVNEHVRNNDFEKHNVQEIEGRAHGL